MPKQRRTFTHEFKRQMVQLYENGKPRAAIARGMNLVHLPLIAGLSKRKRQARFPKKIIEPLKK